MINITLIYLAKDIDRKFNGLYNALSIQGFREQYQNKLQNAIKDIVDIDKIIAIVQNIKDEKSILTPNSAFIVNINNTKYFLDSNFQILDDEVFYKKNFYPYIKFDKSNVDINIESKRVNEKIQSLNSDEAIKFIETYISNPPKQYKQISYKPNRIFIYSIYGKQPQEFLL